MKTLEALYQEIQKSEALRKELDAALESGRGEAFLRTYGCEAGVDEWKALLRERDSAVSDDILSQVSGGAATADPPIVKPPRPRPRS